MKRLRLAETRMICIFGIERFLKHFDLTGLEQMHYLCMKQCPDRYQT